MSTEGQLKRLGLWELRNKPEELDRELDRQWAETLAWEARLNAKQAARKRAKPPQPPQQPPPEQKPVDAPPAGDEKREEGSAMASEELPQKPPAEDTKPSVKRLDYVLHVGSGLIAWAKRMKARDPKGTFRVVVEPPPPAPEQSPQPQQPPPPPPNQPEPIGHTVASAKSTEQLLQEFRAEEEEHRVEQLEALGCEALYTAMVFAVKMLYHMANCTSKHCDDCLVNRWRARVAIAEIVKLAGVPGREEDHDPLLSKSASQAIRQSFDAVRAELGQGAKLLLYLAERERAKAQHAAAARGEKLIAGGSMSFEEELKWAGMWSLRSNLEELGKALAVRFAELQERENAPEQLPQPQPQPFQPPQKSRTTPEERQHLDELIESMDLDDSLD